MIPVCFAYIGDELCIALDEKPKRVGVRRLRRVRNLIENPRATLLVDRYDEDWSRLAYVLVHCEARLLEPGDTGHSEAVREAPGPLPAIP